MNNQLRVGGIFFYYKRSLKNKNKEKNIIANINLDCNRKRVNDAKKSFHGSLERVLSREREKENEILINCSELHFTVLHPFHPTR
jgi:hypothetical protein